VLRSSAYALTILLSLVSAPLLIRHLGISAFGRYTTVIALVTIVGGLTDAGLLNIALREWTTHSGQPRRELMRSLLRIRLELSGAGVLAGVAFALVAGYDEVLVLGTLLAGIGMLLQVTANLLTVPLQGDLRFGWASLIDVLRQTVAVGLIVVLVLLGAHLLPFLAVTIPAALAALVLAAWLVRDRMPLVPAAGRTDRWPLVRETLPYAAAIALNTFYFRVTIVVMSIIAVPRQTGYFATSFRVTEVLVGVPALAVGAAFPILARAAHDSQDRFAYACARILELALIVGTAVALAVVLSAPFLIDVLAGRAGAPAAGVLQIQSMALVASFLGVATGYALLSLRRYVALLVVNGVAVVANILLTVALVSLEQAKGAAIAAVAAESGLALTQLVLLLRMRRTRVRPRALPGVAVAALAGASPLLIQGLHPLLRAAAGVALYTLVLGLVGLTPPEISHLFRRRASA